MAKQIKPYTPDDLARFRALARRNVIPEASVEAFAELFGAMRRAFAAVGSGYQPLEAVVEALPRAYTENWIQQRYN